MRENGVLKRLVLSTFIAGVAAALLLVTACSEESSDPDEQPTAPSGYEGKRILVIHSYHPEVQGVIAKNDGLKSVLDEAGVEYRTIYMDTKRNTDEEFKKEAALKARQTIEQYEPDVVITIDDNAFKYLIMPYYRDSELPVVFAGIDWDASIYGAPYTNTTGMVSVALVRQTIERLEAYADGSEVGWLGHDSLTARKQTKAYEDVLGLNMSTIYVDDFEEWKSRFLELQTEVDILIHSGMLTDMEDWDDSQAEELLLNNIKVPIGTVNRAMMPYSVFGLAKDQSEYGEWAARTALRILDGADPADIPEVTNKEAIIMVNLDLAEKLDIVFSPDVLKNAEISQ